MNDLAQWMTEHRENIAGFYGIHVIPADWGPEDVLAWLRGEEEVADNDA